MAYVKILPNKSKIGMYNLLKYLMQNHDDKVYASTSNLATDPKRATAMVNAINTNAAPRKGIKVHCQHLIQSFSPKDKLDAVKANQLGHELMERLGYKQYAYNVVTHFDKDHLHNHIVFCPTSLITKKQYQSNKKELNRIRNVSDEICLENSQTRIEKKEFGVKDSYLNWTHWQRINSIKRSIKNSIDNAIQYSKNYDDLVDRLDKWGYEVDGKQDNLYVKHHSLKYAINVSRFGQGYEKEKLAERIFEIIQIKKATKNLLALSKYRTNRGRNLAAIENIKIMSHALHFMKKNHLDSVYDFTIRESELSHLKEQMTIKMTELEEGIRYYQDFFTDIDVVENNSALLKQYLECSPDQKQEMMQKYNMEQMLQRLERSHSFYVKHKGTLYDCVQRQCDLLEKLQILKEEMKELHTQIDIVKNAKDVLLQNNILTKKHSDSDDLQKILLNRMKEFAQTDEYRNLLKRRGEKEVNIKNSDFER